MVSSALFGFTIFGGIYTLLLNLYLLRLGYSPGFVGVVNASGMLALALFSLPAGALGGRWGSRRTLIAGLSLIVIGLGLLPLAELVPVPFRRGWLVGTYMIAWLGVAMYFVNTNPFLMVVTTAVERNHVFSVQVALWPIAGFAGSLVGGVLPDHIAGLLRVPLDHPAPYRSLPSVDRGHVAHPVNPGDAGDNSAYRCPTAGDRAAGKALLRTA